MPANTATASTAKKSAITSRAPAVETEYSKPAPSKIAFQQIQFGFWRASTPTHWLHIRLVMGKTDHRYTGQLVARPSCNVVAETTSSRFVDTQRKLIAAYQAAIDAPADRPERALMRFEEFDSADAEQKLLRRANAHAKRWRVTIKSEKFSRGKIDNRPTLILTVVTEATR